MLLQLGQESVASLLGVSEQHGGVLVEEDRVVDGSVADAERSLHDNDLEKEEVVLEAALHYSNEESMT